MKTFCHFLQSKHFTWPLFSVVVVEWSWALINAIINEWNKITLSEYLEDVYIALNKKKNLRSNLIIVHIVVHISKKKVLSIISIIHKKYISIIHKKFSKYLKIKSLILECMGILIHCDTLNDLDCYDQFMILLTSCSTKTCC